MEWEYLADAFTADNTGLRTVVGLFRVQLHGRTMYIVRATETKGGIAKGLRRISGPDQTGNQGYGAQMVRKFIDQVKIEILRVEGVPNPSGVAKSLKNEMNKLYAPIWAIPAKRRMKMVADGVIPPN